MPDARYKHYLEAKIECLRDNINKIENNDSASCLIAKKFQFESQCELRRKNPPVKEWEELEKDCQEIEKLDKRITELLFQEGNE